MIYITFQKDIAVERMKRSRPQLSSADTNHYIQMSKIYTYFGMYAILLKYQTIPNIGHILTGEYCRYLPTV